MLEFSKEHAQPYAFFTNTHTHTHINAQCTPACQQGEYIAKACNNLMTSDIQCEQVANTMEIGSQHYGKFFLFSLYSDRICNLLPADTMFTITHIYESIV